MLTKVPLWAWRGESGGDFNARALDYGMPHTDPSGKRILVMVAKTGLRRKDPWRSFCIGIFGTVGSRVASSKRLPGKWLPVQCVGSGWRYLSTPTSPVNVARLNTQRFLQALGAGTIDQMHGRNGERGSDPRRRGNELRKVAVHTKRVTTLLAKWPKRQMDCAALRQFTSMAESKVWWDWVLFPYQTSKGAWRFSTLL